MPTNEDADPFARGRAAAERGERAPANPHPPGSEAHRRWEEGRASVTAPAAIADELADELADFA